MGVACLLALAWGQEGCGITTQKGPAAPSLHFCAVSYQHALPDSGAPGLAPICNLSIGYLVVNC